MMSLHAEPSVAVGSDGPVPPESEFSFQTHVMKVSVHQGQASGAESCWRVSPCVLGGGDETHTFEGLC